MADACLSHLDVLEKVFRCECGLSLSDQCRLFALELLGVMCMWH